MLCERRESIVSLASCFMARPVFKMNIYCVFFIVVPWIEFPLILIYVASCSKWADEDVDRLKDALTRFAHELDNISESVQTRTTTIKFKMASGMKGGGGGAL
ncbi:unnamed protein product, partial [Toxocara canis]|uniref:Uncharacterized protein n=1 Tax=Toxocara canis TaxID=6265 RepID=A0A183U8Z2_TOXCA